MNTNNQTESLLRKSVALQLASIIAVSVWGNSDPDFAAACKKDFDARNEETVNQLSIIKKANYATTESNEKEGKASS